MAAVSHQEHFLHTPIQTPVTSKQAMLRKPICYTLCIAIALGGCATSSQDITSTYVSPLQYQAYDCGQLAAEAQRIQSRVIELGGRLDQAAQNDKALMGVGLVLFWPVLFAVGGTKAQEAEYGRLKGEYDAVQRASIEKKCTAQSNGGAPPATAPAQAVTSPRPVAANAPTQAPVSFAVAEFQIVDGYTKNKRTVEVQSRDAQRGKFPGTGDFEIMMPPGGWIPPDAEMLGQWTRRYVAADSGVGSKVEVNARIGPRTTLSIRNSQLSVLPVTYTGWMKRNVGYGDLIVEHKATFRIWYSTELGVPVKFESSIDALGNYKLLSKESLELVRLD